MSKADLDNNDEESCGKVVSTPVEISDFAMTHTSCRSVIFMAGCHSRVTIILVCIAMQTLISASQPSQ